MSTRQFAWQRPVAWANVNSTMCLPHLQMTYEAMQQAAEVDAVARQYTNGFADIFDVMLPWFWEELSRPTAGEAITAIRHLQVRWLAHEPDGLIVRKVGHKVAQQVQRLAADLWIEIRAGGRIDALPSAKQLDQFLRSDGHRHNPGTTADLIAATLLVALLLPSHVSRRRASQVPSTE
ncbi:MAG: triphosphoribosyl-dephospho-CoA synthase [Pirellulaceae bacterium]